MTSFGMHTQEVNECRQGTAVAVLHSTLATVLLDETCVSVNCTD